MTTESRTDRPDDRAQARLSKFLALVLRHKAHQFDLKVDDEGFVDLGELLDVMDDEGLDWVTEEDIDNLSGSHVRKRFEVRGDRIRATYGHSFRNPIRFEVIDPPEVLYVGMSPNQASVARRRGIHPIGRQYVHLTDDRDEAIQVGSRGGEVADVVVVKAKGAAGKGVDFHLPTKGLFLCAQVPAIHLEGYEETPEEPVVEPPVRAAMPAASAMPAAATKPEATPAPSFGRRSKRRGRR